MVWLTGYTYRKSHDIAAATGAGTNYQKRITAHYAAPHYQHSMIEDVDDFLCGCGENNQRQSFYGAGLYWIFYCDDDDIVYKTSSDGVNWSPKIVFKANRGRLYPLSIFWSAPYLHTIISVPTTDYLWYRRGTPNPDGTITWTAESQITNYVATSPCLAKDSDGKIWVVYWKYAAPSDGFYVSKNTKTDGSWTNAPGYPLRLAAPIDATGRAQGSICALTSGKMYAAYGKVNAAENTASLVYGKLYNGSNWGSEETISDYVLNLGGGIYVSVDAKDDDVYLTYLCVISEKNRVSFNKRVYGVGWGTNEYISPDSFSSTAKAMTFNPTTDELWAFYADISTDLIYVRKRTSSGWQDQEQIYDFSGIHDLELFNVCAWRRPWDGYPACQFDSNAGVANKVWWLHYAHDINEHVYLSENCQVDFEDVRFTDDDGDTLLDYWMQEKVDSDYAIFWAKIADDLSTETQTIYVYYDNDVASYPVGGDQTEMDATFLFADHFYGDSLDNDKWDEVNSPGINVADSICTVTSGDTNWRSISSDNSFGVYGIAWMSKKQLTVNQFNYAGMQNTAILADDCMVFFCAADTNEYAFTQNEGSGNRADTVLVIDSDYHNYEITWKSGQCKFYTDKVLKATHTTYIPDEVLKAWIESYNTSQSSDWVAIRKFVDPEPVHGVWGNAESEPGEDDPGLLLGCFF